MSACDRQKNIEPLLKTSRILLPEQIVEKDPHGIHAQVLSPA